VPQIAHNNSQIIWKGRDFLEQAPDQYQAPAGSEERGARLVPHQWQWNV